TFATSLLLSLRCRCPVVFQYLLRLDFVAGLVHSWTSKGLLKRDRAFGLKREALGRRRVGGFVTRGFAPVRGLADVFVFFEIPDRDPVPPHLDLSVIGVAHFPQGLEGVAVESVKHRRQTRLAFAEPGPKGEEPEVSRWRRGGELVVQV